MNALQSFPTISRLYQKLGVKTVFEPLSNLLMGALASYDTENDVIDLPPEPSEDQGERDVTEAALLHELIHWTSRRVGRKNTGSHWGSPDEAIATVGEEITASDGAIVVAKKILPTDEARRVIRELRAHNAGYIDKAPNDLASQVRSLRPMWRKRGVQAANFILSKWGKT